MKSKLNIFLQTSQCKKSIKIAHIKIGSLDQKIKELSSVRNVQIVEDYIRNLECDEKFSHCGMWKLRKKLHPSKQMDPPMAKLDKDGNLITAPPLIRKLYLETYVDRLRHREMNTEFVELFHLKNELWKRQLELLRLKKSPIWTINDLNKVLKKLKNTKSRDP